MLLLRVLVFLAGVVIVAGTFLSALQTFVLPRSTRDPLTRLVFRVSAGLFGLALYRTQTYAERDRVMAHYAPITLLALPAVWLTFVLIGYMAMYWAVGVTSLRQAFTLSGSSLLTLGFAPVVNLPTTLLAFSEALIGLVLVALLIAYLPTMYGAFSRREAAVNMLEVRAGSPPSAVELIVRFHRINRLHLLNQLWTSWEIWFVDLEESHTSLAALAFFRSPHPEHSWVTAAGAVLDAAALVNAVVAVPRDSQADLCLRAGYLALQTIADFFRIPYDRNPAPDDPISVSRAEFDAACEQMAAAGVELKADRDRAWRDFAGWRVNYDTVLLALASLTMAPEAPWSSDRVIRYRRTSFLRRSM
ncbi:MAG TPA: hypothetical protein VFZ66_05475 [Herpetosiphonaceae bacterium]